MKELEVDIEGARAKIQSLKNRGKAEAYQLTAFGAKAVLAVKTAGILGTRSAHLMRNVGMDVRTGKDRIDLLLGTGVGRAKSVKYARIHEEGGEIRPKGHPFLTIPLPGVRGKARDYPEAFLATTAGGQWIIAQRQGKGGLKVLFLLRRMVRIPARRWFSRPLRNLRPELDRMLSAEALWEIAQRFGVE